MIIAGSDYCDKDILDTLSVGVYFDVSAEPDNPHDKDAVLLTYNGNKIGYAARQDKLPLVTCMRLGRRLYGVITDVTIRDGKVKYEYETWISTK